MISALQIFADLIAYPKGGGARHQRGAPSPDSPRATAPETVRRDRRPAALTRASPHRALPARARRDHTLRAHLGRVVPPRAMGLLRREDSDLPENPQTCPKGVSMISRLERRADTAALRLATLAPRSPRRHLRRARGPRSTRSSSRRVPSSSAHSSGLLRTSWRTRVSTSSCSRQRLANPLRRQPSRRAKKMFGLRTLGAVPPEASTYGKRKLRVAIAAQGEIWGSRRRRTLRTSTRSRPWPMRVRPRSRAAGPRRS